MRLFSFIPFRSALLLHSVIFVLDAFFTAYRRHTHKYIADKR